jgi:hypothetical protein
VTGGGAAPRLAGGARTSLALLAVAAALAAPPPARAGCGPDDPPGRPEKVWLVPIVEAIAYDVGLWLIDRYALDASYSHISPESVTSNVRAGFRLDDDDFNTNHFLHPYHGSSSFLAARSAGHGFWTSGAFALSSSILWEVAGETQAPSTNDLIMNTAGGTVLGEALFRASRLVLDRRSHPGIARRTAAFLVAPAAGLNDALLGGVICDPDPPPPVFRARLVVGGGGGTADAREGRVTAPAQPLLGATLDYGLPADTEPGAPFDHFRLSLTFLGGTEAPWSALDAVRGPAWLLSIDGLVAGGSAAAGEGRVLYGLFGSFDFGGPILLRVSETGVGPGISAGTGPGAVTAEGTLLATATFGSGGGRVPLVDQRDYRHAFGTLLVGRGRLAFARRLALEAGLRAFLVPEAIGGGSEHLEVGEASLVVRLAGPHGLALQGLASWRGVDYPDSRYTERATFLGLAYAYLVDPR